MDERRKYIRHETDFLGFFSLDGKMYHCILKNFSKGGVLVRIVDGVTERPNDTAAGSEIQITINKGDHQELFVGNIIRIHQATDGLYIAVVF